MKRYLIFIPLVITLLAKSHTVTKAINQHTNKVPSTIRSKTAVKNQLDSLKNEFKSKGFSWGEAVFFRIIKNTYDFEVWIKKGATYELFTTYKICTYSGGLGTKKKQGDNKSPEGLYTIYANQMNPNSDYHLAFNIGYPNNYERKKGYTGSAIMIHGSCVSIGCYAMTNPIIEKIWTIMDAAYTKGQEKIQLHIFPFKLSNANLEKEEYKVHEDYNFWKELQEPFNKFEHLK
jgi:murein L,D-transpeptidase YafK